MRPKYKLNSQMEVIQPPQKLPPICELCGKNYGQTVTKGGKQIVACGVCLGLEAGKKAAKTGAKPVKKYWPIPDEWDDAFGKSKT